MKNKDIKVVFVNASLTTGGSERVMTLVANYCASQDIQVTMLLVRLKSKTYYVAPNVNLIQLNNNYSKIRLLFQRILDIRREIKKANADTVVAFMEDISFFTVIACLGLHKRVVLSIRNNPLRPDKKFQYWLSKHVNVHLASKIVFQTSEAQACYPKRIMKKSIIIPNPISESILPPVHAYHPSNRIVAIGRMVPQKGFDMVITAFKKFRKSNNNYTLELYGSGQELERLQTLAKSLGIEESVVFHGHVSDVIEKIQDARMYVSGSDFEGISNTMLESMASGLPVICTDCPCGGAAMVIKNRLNGILIPVRDIRAMSEAMCEIANDISFAERLSKEAVKVRKEYSLERIGTKWIEIF